MHARDRRILVLDPADDVAVACVDLAAGETVTIDSTPVVLERDVPTGHKLARRAIAAGAVVLKYGAPIGRARTAIAPGAYVHTHNLRSDYIPTWDREGREMTEAPEG